MSNGFSPFAMMQGRVQPDTSKIGAKSESSSAAKPKSAPKTGESSFMDTLAANAAPAAKKPAAPVAPKPTTKTPETPAPSKVNKTIDTASKTVTPKASEGIDRSVKPDLAKPRVTNPVADAAVSETASQVNGLSNKVGSEVAKAADKGPLGSLADKAGKIVGDSPVLSFLNGDYGKFTPEGISNFIAESGFLNTALNQNDIQGFMNSPQPLGKLLQDLQLSPELIDQIQQLGLNMEELSTLRQVFEVLGMNPAKMADEIETLRTNLQMAGTSMYMRKAAKMRAQGRMTKEAPVAVENADTKLAGKNDVSKLPLDNKLDTATDDKSKDDEVVTVTSTTPPIVANKQTQFSAQPIMRPGVAPMPAKPTGMNVQKSAEKPMASLSDMGFTPVAPETLDLDMAKLQPELAVTKDQAPKADVKLDTLVQAPQTGAAQAQMTTVNAFDALGQKLDLAQTNTLNLQAPQLNTKAEAAPAMFNFDTVAVPATAPTVVPAAGTLSVDAAKPTSNASVMEMLSRNYLEKAAVAPSIEQAPAQQAATQSYNLADMTMNAAMDAGAQSPVSKEVQQAKLEMQLERLALGLDAKVAAPAATLGDQGAQPDLGQSNSGANMFDQFGLSQNVTNNIAQKTDETSFVTQLAKAEAPSFGKPIVENATMMLHQGGGTIQLDLGTAEFGELKVALNLNDQQLDVRILASSTAARDMLTQELPKLRDSLAQQNMTLNHVQVGVGSESAQQQFSGGFSRQDAQNFQDGMKSIRSNARQAARSFVPRASYAPTSRMQNHAIHSGQIQVSV